MSTSETTIATVVALFGLIIRTLWDYASRRDRRIKRRLRASLAEARQENARLRAQLAAVHRGEPDAGDGSEHNSHN
jgi:hypothetical protein